MVESLPGGEPAAKGKGLGGMVRDVGSLWGRLSGASGVVPPDSAMTPQPTMEDQEFVPLVLVVGATGRTGRIIVRKLVLQGFRVAVLVRSLSSDTLNLLGSGVSYSYGDMQDYRTLLDAMEDVDKIVFVASSSEPDAELEGLSNVMRAFQDTRTFMYGEAEATKLNLFKFRKDADFARWQIEDTRGSRVGLPEKIIAEAGAGGGSTAIAYWKRSVGSHTNAVFVGRVFDNFLGSAVASCDFTATVNAAAASPLSAASRLLLPEDAAREEPESFESVNFGEYSGLVLKAIGDGQRYTMVVRTSLHAEMGIEYHADFATRNGSFVVTRLPFSTFQPHVNGVPVVSVRGEKIPELDRRTVSGLGIAFFPQRNEPDRCDGSFYLSLAHIKAYRRRNEPEIVYMSDATVTDNVDAADALPGSAPRFKREKRQKDSSLGENLRSAAPDDEAGVADDEAAAKALVDGVSDLGDAASIATAVAQELRTYSPEGDAPTDAAQEAANAAARAAAAAQEVVSEAKVAEAMAEDAEDALQGEEAERRGSEAMPSAASDASETEADGSAVVEADSTVGGAVKARGEAMVRSSGLTYFIVRPTKLNDNPGGVARIAFSQERVDARRSVSRADLAEVVVRSLLDPRACNVACAIAESDYARLAGEPPQQDISKMLEVMQPNRT